MLCKVYNKCDFQFSTFHTQPNGAAKSDTFALNESENIRIVAKSAKSMPSSED